MVNLDDCHLLNLLLFILQWFIVFLELWPSLLLMDKEPSQEVFCRLLLPFLGNSSVQEHCHLCWFYILLFLSFVDFLLTQFVAPCRILHYLA